MKSKFFLVRAALAAALTAGAGLAQAQAGPNAEQLAQRLTQADANHDGYLDRSEVADMPRLKRGFDRIDADGDGRLSRAELQAAGQKLKQRQAGQSSSHRRRDAPRFLEARSMLSLVSWA